MFPAPGGLCRRDAGPDGSGGRGRVRPGMDSPARGDVAVGTAFVIGGRPLGTRPWLSF